MSYGTLSVEDRRKVDGTTAFEIASLTKVFTALVLADMVNRERVKLDAPVSTCLPDGTRVPQHGGKQITFLDLATHTSGLPLRPTNLASQTALNKYAGYTVAQLYQGLATFELPRDPGSAFEYRTGALGCSGMRSVTAPGRATGHCSPSESPARSACMTRCTFPAVRFDRGWRQRTTPSCSRCRTRAWRPRCLGRVVFDSRRHAQIRRSVPRPRAAAARCCRCDDARAAAAG